MSRFVCSASLAMKRVFHKKPAHFNHILGCSLKSYSSDYQQKNSESFNKPSTSSENNVPASKENTQTTPIFKLSPDSINIIVENGLPVLEIPLPSRNENCRFILKPISDTVGSFCDYLRNEDKGIEIAAIYSCDGTRISRSVFVENLMLMPHFRLRLNDQYFDVNTPQANVIEARKVLETSDRLKCLNDVRSQISALYAILNIDEFKLERERRLLEKIEEVEQQLRPLEETRKLIEEECERYSVRVLWGCFIAMGVQTGIFARLTWVDYSWDIVEPCTYFATYLTVVGTLAYYIFTKQSFEYHAVERRFFTNQFHKRAAKYSFNIEHYNELKRLQIELRRDLDRIRDPLYQHLPATRLASLELGKNRFKT